MPYRVEKSDKCRSSHPWAVVKETDGEVMGCHKTKADAEKQQAALYANEPKEDVMDLSKLTALADDLRTRTNAAQRKTGRRWFDIRNVGEASTIHIYDMIGEWGVTAQDFVNELRGLNSRSIDLHINSEGGQVFDGIAIYTALKNHPAYVTTYVDALAASAASFIAQAGDRRVMERNARMMIHDAQGVVLGNAKDARTLADLLDDTSDNIASIYAERSGTDAKDWRKAMRNESWYSADEAVAAGLADEVAGSAPTNQLTIPVVPELNNETGPGWDFDVLSAVKEAMQ